MNPQKIITLLIGFIFAFQPITGSAFETDQYNLPPETLADIGNEIEEYVDETLRLAVEKINIDIAWHSACLTRKLSDQKQCGSADGEARHLSHLRSDNSVPDEILHRLGGTDIMFTKFGKWIRSHKFRNQPDRYKTSYRESIFILNPADYLTVSPTVRLYDTEFGIDKLEHFFQQGHQYYEIERKAITNRATEREAKNKAVHWGQKTERTYYGLLTSGVYSNADLYANYAGMKFYQGLTKPLLIGGKIRPATVELVNGRWEINPEAIKLGLLRPFITAHLNEAFNPSSFRFTLFRSVTRAVKKFSCPEWRSAFPDLTADSMTAKSNALKLWNEEDYGYTKKNRTVTIAEACFQKF